MVSMSPALSLLTPPSPATTPLTDDATWFRPSNTKFWKCHSVQKLNNNVTLWFKKNLFFHTDKLGFPYIETEHRTKKTEFHWGCSLCFQKVVYVLKSRPSGLFGGTTWGASCPRSQEGIAFDPRRGQLSGPQTFLFMTVSTENVPPSRNHEK